MVSRFTAIMLKYSTRFSRSQRAHCHDHRGDISAAIASCRIVIVRLAMKYTVHPTISVELPSNFRPIHKRE